jgi:hypothetical protein
VRLGLQLYHCINFFLHERRKRIIWDADQ